MDTQKAIEALKNLSSLYWSGVGPDTFSEREPPDSKFLEQVVVENVKLARRIDAARRELLATGFPVPNSWLTVEAAPIVSEEQWRVGDSSKFRQLVEFEHPERDRIKAITSEIYAERMRLEALAQAGADPNGAGVGKNPPTVTRAGGVKVRAQKARGTPGRPTLKPETFAGYCEVVEAWKAAKANGERRKDFELKNPTLPAAEAYKRSPAGKARLAELSAKKTPAKKPRQAVA